MSQRAAVPAIVVVSEHAETCAVLSEEIRRRYGADYEVTTRHGADEAVSTLAGYRDGGAEVALVVAGYGERDPEGLEVLSRARRLHPAAMRAVAVG